MSVHVEARPRPRGATPEPQQPPGGGFAAPPRLRRRPGLVAVSVVLVGVGASLAAWVTTTVGDASPVVAARVAVARGEVITADDVTVVRISLDPAVATIPGGDADALVGLRAAVDLPAGSLLTPDSVTGEDVPADGQSVVGIALDPGQLPARALRPGDRVRVVSTPREGDDPPVQTPAAVPVTVVSTTVAPDTGLVVVDVTVPQEAAAGLVAAAATGRVALVLDGTAR